MRPTAATAPPPTRTPSASASTTSRVMRSQYPRARPFTQCSSPTGAPTCPGAPGGVKLGADARRTPGSPMRTIFTAELSLLAGDLIEMSEHVQVAIHNATKALANKDLE